MAKYFRFFAKKAYKRWSPRTIAVTGSVGKTTMLHLLEAELGKKAHYSHGANSMYGVCFDILGLEGVTGSKLRWLYLLIAAPVKSLYFKHKEPYYVMEIDGDRPQGAEFIVSFVKPEITLWISVGLSHAFRFDEEVKKGIHEDLERAITHEFAMVPQYTENLVLLDGDIYLMNKALEKIKKHYPSHSAEVVKCTKDHLKNYAVTPDSATFKMQKHTFRFSAPMPPDLAIQLDMLEQLCKYLKLKVKTDLKDLPLPPGRNSFFKGKHGENLIDSSYNAHLISVESILGMFKQMKVPHKWLVLGDMVEQGSATKTEHETLAKLINNLNPEQTILIGPRLKKYTASKLKKKPFVTTDQKEALKYIEDNVKGSETIVFKGSQYLEWIIEKLLKDPEDAQYLPRREKAAIKRRKKWGLE